MMTSANGTDLALASPQSNRRRRRRALDNNFEFAIATTGGEPGGNVVKHKTNFKKQYEIVRNMLHKGKSTEYQMSQESHIISL